MSCSTAARRSSARGDSGGLGLASALRAVQIVGVPRRIRLGPPARGDRTAPHTGQLAVGDQSGGEFGGHAVDPGGGQRRAGAQCACCAASTARWAASTTSWRPLVAAARARARPRTAAAAPSAAWRRPAWRHAPAAARRRSVRTSISAGSRPSSAATAASCASWPAIRAVSASCAAMSAVLPARLVDQPGQPAGAVPGGGARRPGPASRGRFVA